MNLLAGVALLGVLGGVLGGKHPPLAAGECNNVCECKPTVKLEWTPGVENCHNATYEWLLHTAVGQVSELNDKLADKENIQQQLENEKEELRKSMNKIKDKNTKHLATIDGHESTILKIKKEKNEIIDKLEAKVKSAEDGVSHLAEEKKKVLDTLEPKIARRDREIVTLKEQIEVLQGRVGRRDNTIEKKNVYITKLEKEKADSVADIKRLQQILDEQDEAEKKASLPRDCADVQTKGSRYSGLYTVYPEGLEEGVEVFCDLNTEGGGWTVLQRRQDGSVKFERGWEDYKVGFGKSAREFWLGNAIMHMMTSNEEQELRVDIGDYKGNVFFAHYNKFSVGSEADHYKLMVEGYNGDAGDALTHHSGKPFTTIDKDNDRSESANCAQLFGGGGWWYAHCYDSNLNGAYGTRHEQKGIAWFQLHKSFEAMRHTEMKMRPNGFMKKE